MSKNNQNEMLKQRLANLVDSYIGGTPYQLDDETRTAICMELDTKLIKPSVRYAFSYGNYPIPYYFNKYVFTEALFEEKETFEIRGENEIAGGLTDIKYLLAELRALLAIEAINTLNFKYLSDEILMNVYAVITKFADKIADQTNAIWYEPNKLEEVYDKLPTEFKSSFKFSREIKKRLDDEAKQAKDRAAQTQNNGEGIPQ